MRSHRRGSGGSGAAKSRHTPKLCSVALFRTIKWGCQSPCLAVPPKPERFSSNRVIAASCPTAHPVPPPARQQEPSPLALLRSGWGYLLSRDLAEFIVNTAFMYAAIPEK